MSGPPRRYARFQPPRCASECARWPAPAAAARPSTADPGGCAALGTLQIRLSPESARARRHIASQTVAGRRGHLDPDEPVARAVTRSTPELLIRNCRSLLARKDAIHQPPASPLCVRRRQRGRQVPLPRIGDDPRAVWPGTKRMLHQCQTATRSHIADLQCLSCSCALYTSQAELMT